MSCAAVISDSSALGGGGNAPGSPVASFTVSATNVYAGSQVFFTDTSSGYPTSWDWEVNGSQLSTAQNPIFTPFTPGVYVVFLTVTNSFGSNTTMAPTIITAHN